VEISTHFTSIILLLTRDEHGFGFKSGAFSAFSWIWIGFYKFCLTGFGLDLIILL